MAKVDIKLKPIVMKDCEIKMEDDKYIYLKSRLGKDRRIYKSTVDSVIQKEVVTNGQEPNN